MMEDEVRDRQIVMGEEGDLFVLSSFDLKS